jgi:GntR family transcriptional regulator
MDANKDQWDGAGSTLRLGRYDRRRDEARRLRDMVNTILEQTRGNPPRLPDERLISRGFGVSRNTVREALQLLVGERRVQRNVGSGSFAHAVPNRSPFDRIIDFSKTDLDLPANAVARTIGFRTLAEAPPTMREALGLPVGMSLAIFERIVLRDAVPVELRTYFMPLRAGEAVTEQDAVRDIYELIELRFARPIRCALRAVSAMAADPSSADLLAVPLGSPLLFMESRLVGEDGAVLLVTYGRHRPDQITVTFRAERVRTAPT